MIWHKLIEERDLHEVTVDSIWEGDFREGFKVYKRNTWGKKEFQNNILGGAQLDKTQE